MTNEERAREVVIQLNEWLKANHNLDDKGRQSVLHLGSVVARSLDDAEERGHARGFEDAADWLWKSALFDRLEQEHVRLRDALEWARHDFLRIICSADWSIDQIQEAARVRESEISRALAERKSD